MTTLFSIVGALMGLSLSISAAAYGIAWLVECLRESRRNRDLLVASDAKREVGRLLLYYCHWFSEDAGAWKAVEAIGRDLAINGDFSMPGLRDKWLEEMGKQEVESTS